MGLRYKRIRINGQWWKWDEKEEVLKNGRKIERKEKQR